MLEGLRELTPLRELDNYPTVKQMIAGAIVGVSFLTIYLSMVKTSRIALESFDLIQPRETPARFTAADILVIGGEVPLALFAIWQALNFNLNRR